MRLWNSFKRKEVCILILNLKKLEIWVQLVFLMQLNQSLITNLNYFTKDHVRQGLLTNYTLKTNVEYESNASLPYSKQEEKQMRDLLKRDGIIETPRHQHEAWRFRLQRILWE